MFFFYNLILTALAVILSPIILILFIIKPKLRAGFWQKIGFYGIKNEKPSIWIHAVSVGEVNAVENFVKSVKENFPEYKLVLTTVTRTGQQVANNKLSKIADIITYFPYDFSFSVNAAIKAINPKVAIIAETEIWPNFSRELSKKNIPLVLVNGRISPSSYKGYKKFSFFFKNILKNYSSILMQTEDDKNRITDIGASPDTVEVMGNLKFDLVSILNSSQINDLKNSLKIENKKVLIAGSTHQGEEKIILNVFARLKNEFGGLKMILAPRHPERNAYAEKLISETPYSYGLKSERASFKESDIILLDTMGELGKLYSIANLAFLGGSFSNTGRHNPLEAAIYGVPVVSGSTVFNFKDIYNILTSANAAKVVNTEQEVYLQFRELLLNENKYCEMSKACKEVFEENKGALDYAINKLRFFIA